MTDHKPVLDAAARAIAESEDEWDGKQDSGSATLGPWNKFPDHWKEQYRYQARAALTVVLDMMREPSEAVSLAMYGPGATALDNRPLAIAAGRETWQAMHDHLRKEILGDE